MIAGEIFAVLPWAFMGAVKTWWHPVAGCRTEATTGIGASLVLKEFVQFSAL